MKGICIAVSTRAPKVVRRVEVTSLDECKALAKQYRNCDIGLRLGLDEHDESEPLWSFFPDFDGRLL